LPPNVVIVTGPGAAYRSIQTLYGEPPAFILDIDQGIMDIKVIPTKDRKGVRIKYVPDRKRITKGDISLKGIKAQ